MPPGSEPPSILPRVITVMLDPDNYPPVTNHHQLVEALEDVAAPQGFKARLGAAAGGQGLPAALCRHMGRASLTQAACATNAPATPQHARPLNGGARDHALPVQVQVVSLTMEAPFASHLATMAGYVAVCNWLHFEKFFRKIKN